MGTEFDIYDVAADHLNVIREALEQAKIESKLRDAIDKAMQLEDTYYSKDWKDQMKQDQGLDDVSA